MAAARRDQTGSITRSWAISTSRFGFDHTCRAPKNRSAGFSANLPITPIQHITDVREREGSMPYQKSSNRFLATEAVFSRNHYELPLSKGRFTLIDVCAARE